VAVAFGQRNASGVATGTSAPHVAQRHPITAIRVSSMCACSAFSLLRLAR
jgi:hypothetical protein